MRVLVRIGGTSPHGIDPCQAARLIRWYCAAMITPQDIKDMTCLTREEIAAVAEDEHVPDLNTSLMGDYIMRLHKGPQKVQQMICDDIRAALQRHDLDHARDLYIVLHHFLDTYPEAARGAK